jgi:hypothetical protein
MNSVVRGLSAEYSEAVWASSRRLELRRRGGDLEPQLSLYIMIDLRADPQRYCPMAGRATRASGAAPATICS